MNIYETDNPLSILGVHRYAIDEALDSGDLERLLKIAESTHKMLAKWFHPDQNPLVDFEFMNSINQAIDEIRDKEVLAVYLEDFRTDGQKERKPSGSLDLSRSKKVLLSLSTITQFVDQFDLLDIDKPKSICALENNVLKILDISSSKDATLNSYSGEHILDISAEMVKYQNIGTKFEPKFGWKIHETSDKSRANKWSVPSPIAPAISNLHVLGTVLRKKKTTTHSSNINFSQLEAPTGTVDQIIWLELDEAWFLDKLEVSTCKSWDSAIVDKTRDLGIVVMRNSAREPSHFRPVFSVIWGVLKIVDMK